MRRCHILFTRENWPFSGRWEIMVWSKTTSSENRVSAGIAVVVPGHTQPHEHCADPSSLWITGLRPHRPLSGYPLTNLLTRAQRVTASPIFALRHGDQSKCGPAGCSWEHTGGDMEIWTDWRPIWKSGQEIESSVVERGQSTAGPGKILSSGRT